MQQQADTGDGATMVVWDDALSAYDLGGDHPLNPVRLGLTMDLARQLGVLDVAGLDLVAPQPATDELLEMVHDPSYLHAVKNAPDDMFGRMFLRWGLGTPDNPVFHGMHEAAALVAGASLRAADAVRTGTHAHAVSIAGGLHHAMPNRASGFCVYNDAALAIARLLATGVARVAYVDVDVHHGDGVQAVFYDDPRVLTISLHESGRTLFPGTGWPDETGGPGAEGSAVNVALPAGTADGGWLRAFDAVVPPLVSGFAPEVLVTQHGCDTHYLDPLANLRLSVDGQVSAYRRLHELAHTAAGGRWLALGGGGYELVQVVPRAWTHLLAIASHQPLAATTATPGVWRETAEGYGHGVAPTTLSDGMDAAYVPWDAGVGDPEDPVDRAVAATRSAIWPLHGLDPLVVER